MFTGIVTDQGEVLAVQREGDLRARIGTAYDVDRLDRRGPAPRRGGSARAAAAPARTARGPGAVLAAPREGALRARIGTAYDVDRLDIGASVACDGVCL